MEATTLTSTHDQKYYNLAFGLAIFTILYNFAEGMIATWLGYEDETLALFGFGVDSFIELISGVGIMQMVIRIRQHPDSPRGNFEKTALRVTGYSFYLLVAGLVITSILNLYRGHKPETTFWGVVIASISIVVMLVLIYGKIKTGRALHSAAILADANCTKVCIYMSLVLLASSAIYEYTNFAYADSLGTLGLAWFSYQEGKECFEKANNVECSCEHHH